MDSTASTIAGVSLSASVPFSFVARDVRATESRSSRSTSFCNLNVSRNYKKYVSQNLQLFHLKIPSVSLSLRSHSHQ